jgi:glycosyltransferase involved in cell wall biosynthesis
MLVSVIIPTYGDPKFLKASVNSVLNQTLRDFELIIVDDNNPNTESRIKTEQLIAPYLEKDKRIKYIQHEHNKNGAVARNTGISVANGKYISFLDSDDEYKFDRLEKCYKLMELVSEKIGGVYTGCEFRRNGKTYYVEKNVKPGNYLVETIAGSFMFCTGSNIFIRKSILNELNGFDESFLRHQDYEFLVRFFEKYSLEAIKEVLVIKNNENINVPNVRKMIEIKKQYLDKYKYLIENLSQMDQNYIFHTQYVSIAELAMKTKNKDVAKEYYRQSKQYGNLTNLERFRRIAFFMHNLIRS